MAITVTIRKSGVGYVSITLNAAESEKVIDFRNTAMAAIAHKGLRPDPEASYLTYIAMEAACFSGVRYARSKIDRIGIFVEVLSISWGGNIESTEPFAIATATAVCKAFGIIRAQEEMDGWSIEGQM